MPEDQEVNPTSTMSEDEYGKFSTAMDENPTEAPPPSADQDPVEQAKQKEIDRLRAKTRAQAEQLDAVSHKMTELETRQEIANSNDEDLIRHEVGWQNVLDRALASDNEEGAKTAKDVLIKIKLAQHQRLKQGVRQEQTDVQKSEAVQKHYQDMEKVAYEAFPELKDENSPIYQAASEQYRQYAALFSEMGVMGDGMALAMAIIKNPALASSKVTQNMASQMNQVAESAMRKGASSVSHSHQGKRDFTNEPRAEMERFIEMARGGDYSFARNG